MSSVAAPTIKPEPNATTPTYAIGTTFYPNTNPPGESPANVKLYIVEKSVRNLTNTTWKIKEGWSCEAGYGQFNINFINKSGTSGAQYPIWPEFNIGYSYINEDGDMGATPNVIAVQFGGLVYGGGGYPFTISIVGGNDVENPDLIAGFMRALKKGVEYVDTHTPEEIAKIISPQFPDNDKATIAIIIKRYQDQGTWKSDLIFEESAFDLLIDILKTAGELDKDVPYEKLVTVPTY